ncbi:MAG: hypothetical protein AAGA19_04945 [Pseudomonadota bacterium]
MQLRAGDITLFDGFERSVLVIALVARMLVGLGLAIALFLQVYMLVLTDYRCAAEGTSLGNLIRCTDPMAMIAAAITLLAGIGLTATIISPRRLELIETLMMLLCAVVINFLAGLTIATASWQIALVIFSLFAALGSLLLVRIFLPATHRSNGSGSPENSGKTAP